MTAVRAPLLLCAVALTACGTPDRAPVAASCTDGPDTIVRALGGAPGAVTLPDGARLSACIDSARRDGDMQNVGAVFTEAAEDLEVRAMSRPRSALELGYLVGATRRGAARSNGIHAEIVRRLERSAALDGAPRRIIDALNEGLAAGEARG